MIRLLRVELQRLAARKVIWLTLIAAIAISGVVVGGVFMQARSIDQARSGFDQQYEEMVQQIEQDRASCKVEEERERRQSGDASLSFGCDDMAAPTIEEMYPELPSLEEMYRQLLTGLAYPFMFLSLAMGSTGVAAEFAHRTMGAWLTFVPRRTPVFLSKVGAAGIASIPLAIAGLGVLLLGLPAVFRWFRLDDAVTGAQWVSLGWMSLRIIALTVFAGLFGAALAFLLRHSGLVIGAIVGYLVLVEGILASIIGWLSPYALGHNISAVVQDGTSWVTWNPNCNFDAQQNCEIVHTLSLTHGIIVLGVVLVAALLAGWARFFWSDID